MYEDGDSEEMTRDEVLSALCTDEEIANLSPSKTAAIAHISSEFDSKNPDACFRGMLNNRPTGDHEGSLGFNPMNPLSVSSFVAIKTDTPENEDDGDDSYNPLEEGEADSLLLRDGYGKFISPNRRGRYSHSDHGSEDTFSGVSSNGNRKRRRRKLSDPLLGKRGKRRTSSSGPARSESPLVNLSQPDTIDCTTPPPIPTPVKHFGPRRRSDSVVSGISGSSGVSPSSERSPAIVSISNDSESISIDIIDCQ